MLKQEVDEPCPLEPFVVNIPDNISRIDIDQYLKNVQDQRRKGLNYSYTTDDDDDGEEDEEEVHNKSEELPEKRNEPWNEVNLSSISFPSSLSIHLAKTLAFLIR